MVWLAIAVEEHLGNVKHSISFENAIVLGDGFAARLTALMLAQELPLVTVIGPRLKDTIADNPQAQTGHAAHSHIFLPRLEQELTAICPALLAEMKDVDIVFQPGSTRLRRQVPPMARRAFATRWQVDRLLGQLLGNTPTVSLLEYRIRGVELQSYLHSQTKEPTAIAAIKYGHDNRMLVSTQTLVVDALGSNSLVMSKLQDQQTERINQSSHIAYLTQFFKLNPATSDRLPDPLTECVQDFDGAFATLYPGARGWYSVTLAMDARHRSLLKSVRFQDRFLDICQQSSGIREWMDSSQPVGPLRTYINPQNRWNVDAFASKSMPVNYVAVGDSLVTSCPALGAGCSFAATHIRVVKETMKFPVADFHCNFARKIHEEQFPFFLSSLARQPPSGHVILGPSKLRQESHRLRTVRKFVGRMLGLERLRLIRQLRRSSSL